jgi:hypothetical protein
MRGCHRWDDSPSAEPGRDLFVFFAPVFDAEGEPPTNHFDSHGDSRINARYSPKRNEDSIQDLFPNEPARG